MIDQEITPNDFVDTSEAITTTPHCAPPAAYIRIEHHPHDPCQEDLIIPIDDALPAETSPTLSQPEYQEKGSSLIKPWTPFSSRADYELIELVVKGLIKADWAKCLLRGVKGASDGSVDSDYVPPYSWCKPEDSKITFNSYEDMQSTLSRARNYTIAVSPYSHSHSRLSDDF